MKIKTPWTRKRYLKWYYSQWTGCADNESSERIYQDYLKRFNKKNGLLV